MMILRRASLTTRLGLLYALVSIITFACVGAYLYYSLSNQLELRDDQELLGKIGLMRHIAQEAASVASIRNDPHLFLDAAVDHDKMIVILKSSDDKVILHNHANQGELPAMPVVPVSEAVGRESIKLLTTSIGLPARSVAARGALRDSGEEIEIIVARTTSDRMEILKSYRAEVWIAAITGTLMAVIFSYLLVRQGLHPLRTIASLAQSITAQRLDKRLDSRSAPQELQEMIKAFNAMLDRLHESFQRLSQFSADLAHDLRTPLNNLMVQTHVSLSQSRTNEDYQNLMISNTEEYERLARMVESMLFLARAEHAQVFLNKSSLDIGAELQRIADYFEGLAYDAGISIAVKATGIIHADALLLRRAVSNLTANAIRYTPAGGIIELGSEIDGEYTTISVCNPGVGIEEKHLTRLFDRFYRADAARSNSASSTGLGLAIVQSIMNLHAGTAEVKSEPNGKTIFKLKFSANNHLSNT